jgi:outer membrane murein-binding lipoprotein Lpp
MKHRKVILTVLAFAMCMLFVTTLASQAQTQNSAQAQKLNMVVKQLNLSPEQKIKLMPILEDEAPKVEAIKANASLTNFQKLQQLGALHEQTNPQVQAILSPQQYEQLQQIRRHELEQTIQKKRGPQPQ